MLQLLYQDPSWSSVNPDSTEDGFRFVIMKPKTGLLCSQKERKNMKKRTVCKMMSLAVLVIMLATCLLPAALAEDGGYAMSPDRAALAERLRTVQDFKFTIKKDGLGLGLGTLPVYSAPSENSYRNGDGRAACDTDKKMREAGFVAGSLLVCYETSKGYMRVGYIPHKYVKEYKVGDRTFDMIPITIAQPVSVTDDPITNNVPFTTLYPGDVVYVLAKYTYNGNWYYIEFTTAGQTARGFVDRNATYYWLGAGMPADSSEPPTSLATLGNPEISPRGTTQVGEVLIQGGKNGERKNVRKEPNPNSDQVSVVYPGRTYACYGEAEGYAGITWYYVWIEEDSEWGWVISNYASLI